MYKYALIDLQLLAGLKCPSLTGIRGQGVRGFQPPNIDKAEGPVWWQASLNWISLSFVADILMTDRT